MRLNRLAVTDYRNLSAAVLEPAPQLTVLCGANGQGKTNLLEAVWLLTGGKSFRGAKDAELIRRGAAKHWAAALLAPAAHGSVRSANPVPAGRKRFAAPAIVPAAVGQREYQQINPAIYPVVRFSECLSGITRLKWRKISPALPKRIWCKALRAALPRPESGVRRVLVSPAARQPGHKRFPACGLGGFLIRAFRFPCRAGTARHTE